MKYLLLLWLTGVSHFAEAENLNLFRDLSLREHQALIIEIKNVKVTRCPMCHVPTIKVSYELEAQDAYLGVHEDHTARGTLYTPFLKSYTTSVHQQFNDVENPLYLPTEGYYVGTLWQTCAPWGMAADGTCRDWLVKFNLESKIVPLNGL